MSDRRRQPRYELADSWEGLFEATEDVTFGVAEGHLWALCRSAVPKGEFLTVRLKDRGQGMSVRVDDCSPVETDGEVRHRLQLQLVESTVEAATVGLASAN